MPKLKLSPEAQAEFCSSIRTACYHLAECWDALLEAESISEPEIEVEDISALTSDCSDPAEAFIFDAERILEAMQDFIDSDDDATAPLQIPKSESAACSCARGEGRHHPDCPAWDSHTDNYQEAPNAR